jgi:sugar O-acyltransferase (sialic acid O-acetyltransferase NeuD family)
MNNTPGLLIFPFNGNAMEAFDCIGEQYQFLGFIDDTSEKRQGMYAGARVFGREALMQYPQAKVLAVPGSPQSYLQRGHVIDGLGLPTDRFAQVFHPSACVSAQARIGYNVLIMAGAVITSNAVVGNHVCILPNTVVHHDAVIGNSVLIGSNTTIAGHTVIEDNCYIGSGCSIMNGLRVGEGSLIGIGSNVIRDVAKYVRVAGNPARELATTNNFKSSSALPVQ